MHFSSPVRPSPVSPRLKTRGSARWGKVVHSQVFIHRLKKGLRQHRNVESLLSVTSVMREPIVINSPDYADQQLGLTRKLAFGPWEEELAKSRLVQAQHFLAQRVNIIICFLLCFLVFSLVYTYKVKQAHMDQNLQRKFGWQ